MKKEKTMNKFFKEFFKQNPSLLKEPIDCDLICQRIEEYVRLKNKQYLEGLDVRMDDKGCVLIDIKNKVQFSNRFDVGHDPSTGGAHLDVFVNGDGEITIINSDLCPRNLDQKVIVHLSIDEINEISDKAHAHKMAWENQEFNQVEEE